MVAMRGPPAPVVSVIVPAYGVAHLLGEALASLQAQDFSDWEAVVVDDGAPDDVEGAIAAFAGDPRIRLLKTDNQGVATARDRAIRHARADLIALLDGDDRYEPAYLARMVAAIGADPGLGFVSCDAIYFGESLRTGRVFSAFSPQDPPVTLERVLRRAFNVFTGSILRRAAYDAIGGYDPTLRAGEDFDLWLRMLEAGWRGDYLPAPLAAYRRRRESLSMDTLPMLRAVARVYRGSATRLAGRPEAATAEAMHADVLRQIAWEEGETMIRAGSVRDGLARLEAADAAGRSPRWRLTMGLITTFPVLARPIISWRDRMNARG